ncbi:MAG: hypothetical protein ACE15B_20950 [Bryobacteraceae bacterium]
MKPIFVAGEPGFNRKSRPDPGEMHNRASDPACQQRKAELAAEMDRWLSGSPCVRSRG